LASNVGDAFYAVALPWYVLAGHGGALLLAVVLAAYGIPRTALLAVGGHASDRWRPWTVMMGADTLRAAAVAALAVVAVSGPANPYLLIPIAVLVGAGEGLFVPGSFAIVPSLLPDEDLQAGNAITSGGTQLATLIGPAVGGAVVALVGSSPAFTVDAASFAISAVTLARIRAHERHREPMPATEPTVLVSSGSLGEDHPATDGQAPAGLPTLRQLVASERVLQVVIIVLVAANLGSGGMSEVALPALAHGPFHAGAGGYGALVAAFGGGALIGTVIAAHTCRAHRPAVIASIAFLIEAGCLGVIPYLGGTIPAGAALAAFGALNGFGNVITITAFQRWAPPALMGRLMGLLMFAAMGVFPLSVLLGGVVVHDAGPAPFFPLAAVILAVAVIAGLSQRSWRTFGSNDSLPPTTAGCRPRPGPARGQRDRAGSARQGSRYAQERDATTLHMTSALVERTKATSDIKPACALPTSARACRTWIARRSNKHASAKMSAVAMTDRSTGVQLAPEPGKAFRTRGEDFFCQ